MSDLRPWHLSFPSAPNSDKVRELLGVIAWDITPAPSWAVHVVMRIDGPAEGNWFSAWNVGIREGVDRAALNAAMYDAVKDDERLRLALPDCRVAYAACLQLVPSSGLVTMPIWLTGYTTLGGIAERAR